MLNANWRTSDWSQRQGRAKTKRSLPRRTKVKLGLAFCGWMLLLLVLLLSGCHTLPTQPCEMLPPPTMPVLSEALPSVSYSISAGQRIKTWAQSLIDTPVTSKR